MSEIKKRLLRGTMVLTMGQVISYVSSFIRNIILARLLTKTDFGLAAMLGMTVTVLELSGRMAFGQQIIQSKEGKSSSFQATSQAFQFTLSLIGFTLILSASYPVTLIFKIPEYVWAFAVLSAVPLARSIEHLDNYRQQREFNYLPGVLCEIVPQVFITLAVWPLTLWLTDYRVILWMMIAKVSLGVVMTHLLAERTYKWSWDRDHLKKIWGFGWPNLLTGQLIFFSQQSDQLLVGAFYSLYDLAPYTLAASLVSVPWSIFGSVGNSLMLPILARCQDDIRQFRQRYRDCICFVAVVSVISTLPLIISGEQIICIFFGQKYTGSGKIVAILAATGIVRFLRLVPAIASMSRSDTKNQFFTNLFRTLGVPMAIIAAFSGGSINMIASCSLFAECIASIASIQLLYKRHRIPYWDSAGAIIYIICFVTVGMIIVNTGADQWSYLIAFIATVIGLMTAAIVAWIAFPGIRTLIKTVSSK